MYSGAIITVTADLLQISKQIRLKVPSTSLMLRSAPPRVTQTGRFQQHCLHTVYGYPFKCLGDTNWKCFNKTSVFKTAVVLTSVLCILPENSNVPIETNPSKKLLPIKTENVVKRILD